MTIGIAEAEHYKGPYKVVTESPVFPPDKFHIEDPFIWQTESGYELIAKDMDGSACGEKYGGIHAVSMDGLDCNLVKVDVICFGELLIDFVLYDRIFLRKRAPALYRRLTRHLKT